MNAQLQSGVSLPLSSKPLGEGGEGSVYAITGGSYRDSVAKLFKPEKLTTSLERKIHLLLASPPQTTDNNGHAYLVWPTALINQNGRFAGYLMPRTSGQALEKICLYKLDRTLGAEWQRFAHGTPSAQKLRLSICRNLSAAIAGLHDKGCYVLVDAKPANVYVTDDGRVSIIDLDSVQVSELDRLLYPAKVCTPDYTPPEATPVTMKREQSWDNFSLAVMLYRILCGVHPFDGISARNPDITDVMGSIAAGLYAHTRLRQAAIKGKRPNHDNLLKYPPVMVDLFSLCFDEGHSAPSKRPSARDWCQTIDRLLNDPPHIIDFSADRLTVSDLLPVKFRWQVENAQILRFSGTGDVLGTSYAAIQVKRDTAFTLEATSFSGKTVRQTLQVVTDQRPPEVLSFTATHTEISAGDALVLSWQVARSEKITLSPGPGVVSASASITVRPTMTTTFVLRAESVFGVATQHPITVRVQPAPTLSKFAARNSKIKRGQETVLSWHSEHCTKLTLIIGGVRHDVTRLNEFLVRPEASTTFQLLAEGYGGLKRLSEETTIQVFEDVLLEAFTADRPFTIQSVPTVLRWQVSHAQQLTLEPGRIDVTGRTDYEVTPNSSTSYELIARNELTEARGTFRIEVQPLPRLDHLALPKMPSLNLGTPPSLPGLANLAPSLLADSNARVAPGGLMGSVVMRLQRIIKPPSFTTPMPLNDHART